MWNCGPKHVEVFSDRELGILKAVKQLGFVSDAAAPNMKVKNSIAEAAIQTMKGSVSALLLHVGMDCDMWLFAAKCFEFSCSINTMSRVMLDPPVTCFEAAHGYPLKRWCGSRKQAVGLLNRKGSQLCTLELNSLGV